MAFPVDAAAIVSSRETHGFQLDTTIDTGPRTIGFKLTDSCGELMARYGASPLTLNRWYHVAGVYDAEARTMEIYLDGVPDNGDLRGKVTGRQHSSRAPIVVGRHSRPSGFEFAGALDDVRICSMALQAPQIAQLMRGEELDPLSPVLVTGGDVPIGYCMSVPTVQNAVLCVWNKGANLRRRTEKPQGQMPQGR